MCECSDSVRPPGEAFSLQLCDATHDQRALRSELDWLPYISEVLGLIFSNIRHPKLSPLLFVDYFGYLLFWLGGGFWWWDLNLQLALHFIKKAIDIIPAFVVYLNYFYLQKFFCVVFFLGGGWVLYLFSEYKWMSVWSLGIFVSCTHWEVRGQLAGSLFSRSVLPCEK